MQGYQIAIVVILFLVLYVGIEHSLDKTEAE